MAFNNIGPLTFLAPGQTASWSYSYGDDHGTQFASADVKTPNQGAVHLADQQTKRKDNNGVATYSVNIHNLGAGGCFHNLQGGGDVMKMSIVTDAHGNLLAAVQGHSLSESKGGVQATVTFAPGHQVHQVEVDDDMDTITDPAVFQQRLKQHIAKP